MKKFLIATIILFVFTVTLPLIANAQSCNIRKKSYKNNRSNYSNAYYQQNRNQRRPVYYQQNRNYQRPGFWQRNRNLRNVLIGTGGGAVVGGLIGGNRKGLAIGALAGAGSGALYTYVINPKNKKRQRVYRRF